MDLQTQAGYATFYVQIEPFVYTSNGTQGSLNPQSYTVTYADGKITFPADHGLSWVAYTDENYSQRGGYLEVFDILELTKGSGGNADQGNWTSIGNATFMDGWVCPGFDIDQTNPANHYEVELQQNDDNKNLYRLVDPYKGKSPVAQYNESTKTGYIQFDVTDPDHVVFAAVEAGFANEEQGISKFYCLNTLAYAMGYFQVSADEVISQLGNQLPYTTFKDGVVTLSAMPSTEYRYINDACFGIQGDIYGGYSWIDNNDLSFNMATAIYFPGTAINSIAADEADAPVRYFNLQGIEIAQPAPGQVVIRQQGTKAAKITVK